MDFNQLKNFTVIAELGSITKAAATLSVAQPALSRQIKKLEEELGIPLFYRHGHGVSLTDEGQVFLEQSSRLITDFHSLKRNAASWGSQVTGTVSIGMPPTVARVIGSDLVVSFKQKFPEASIELSEGLSGHIHEWLKTGRVDIALLFDTTATRSISTERLWSEELHLYYGPEYFDFGPEIQLKELVGTPIALPSYQHALRFLLEANTRQGDLALNDVTEINSLSVITEVLMKSPIVAILPPASVQKELASGHLVEARIIDPVMTRDLVLATSTQRPISATVRAAVAEVKSIVVKNHEV